MGLGNFPLEGLPSEASMALFESRTKAAKEKLRPFIGAVEGEVLLKLHKPSWARSQEVPARLKLRMTRML